MLFVKYTDFIWQNIVVISYVSGCTLTLITCFTLLGLHIRKSLKHCENDRPEQSVAEQLQTIYLYI